VGAARKVDGTWQLINDNQINKTVISYSRKQLKLEE
jgi:hypothetical protein